MTPWRRRPQTTAVIAQSKRAIAELLATADELDKFVNALLSEIDGDEDQDDSSEGDKPE
jgi:hypothetical protein